MMQFKKWPKLTWQEKHFFSIRYSKYGRLTRYVKFGLRIPDFHLFYFYGIISRKKQEGDGGCVISEKAPLLNMIL